MRLTKLQLVQKVLSAIDSDNVNSISDTVESEQVGLIVDTIYDDLIGDFPWPYLRTNGVLEVTTTAHVMKIPDTVLTLNDVYYNKEMITYIDPVEMTDVLFNRDTTESNIDSNGAYTDRDPIYWTSYDDQNVTFDGYDTSLVSALSYTDYYRIPVPMSSDTDYPDLPARFHNIILYGAIADAFYDLKGDAQGFNIYNVRFKRYKAQLDRWAKRVNRQRATGYDVDFSRKNG